MIYKAEIGKRIFYLSALSLEEAGQLLSFYHKDKMIRVSESSLPATINFKVGLSVLCTFIKAKDSVIYFSTEKNMTGKVDIALLPIELV